MDHEIESGGLFCASCGYDLSGTAVGGRCPECGAPVRDSLPGGGGVESNSLAITSLVLGAISIAGCALLGPVAIILAKQARSQINAGGYSASSHTMARIGYILGIVGTVFAVAQIAFFFLVLGLGY